MNKKEKEAWISFITVMTIPILVGLGMYYWWSLFWQSQTVCFIMGLVAAGFQGISEGAYLQKKHGSK